MGVLWELLGGLRNDSENCLQRKPKLEDIAPFDKRDSGIREEDQDKIHANNELNDTT